MCRLENTRNLKLNKPLLILDLSIPKNVHDNVKSISGVTVVHLDDLSKITDDTLENRKQEMELTRLAHISPFRHKYFWDAGIHCITNDLKRKGSLQKFKL